MHLRSALALGAYMLTIPLAASAHTSGQNFEQKVGEYTVDAGCDQLEFIVGTTNTCSFGLIENAGKWNWNIAHYDTIIFTVTPINPPGEPTKQTLKAEPDLLTFAQHTFTKSGTYTMGVQFIHDDKEVAQTSFPVTVVDTGSWLGPNRLGMLMGGGLIVLSIGTVVLSSWYSKRKKA